MKSSKKNLKDSLLFRDVYITGNTSSLHQDFDPKYVLNLDSLYVQTFSFIDRHEIVGIKDADSGKEKKIFRSYFEFGARWLSDTEEGEDSPTLDDSTKKEDTRTVRATIEASIVSEYVLLQEFDEETLIKYATDELSIEVWPFWREFLVSQISRMHLTGVKMPTRKKITS